MTLIMSGIKQVYNKCYVIFDALSTYYVPALG